MRTFLIVGLALAGMVIPARAQAVTYCSDSTITVENLRVLRTSCTMGRSVASRWRPGRAHRYVAPFTCFYRGGLYGGSVTCRASLGRWVWFGFGD